jgi:hypothetical protein
MLAPIPKDLLLIIRDYVIGYNFAEYEVYFDAFGKNQREAGEIFFHLATTLLGEISAKKQ